MSKNQFPSVDSHRGAPMGRPTSKLGETPKGVRLFKVRLDAGGYDDGGAYWGLSNNIWCAQCPEGGQEFTRASSRISAAAKLHLSNGRLARGIPQDTINAYFRSWSTGRMPESLLVGTDWLRYFAENGCKVFNGE